MDFTIGVLFLMTWFTHLPVDLVSLGIPRWLTGVLGAVFSLSDVIVVMYLLTKQKEPK
jgi:O-antigen/teichoic acid export membrane protein